MDAREPSDSTTEEGRSGRTLAVLFLAMAVLAGSHLGEFWPFSIYPMFSRAGWPWSRAIVRDLSGVPDSLVWKPVFLEDLPGTPFALRDHDIEGPDIANFVVKNRNWSLEGQTAFRKIFLDHLAGRTLMLYRLDGRVDDNEITVRASPTLLMTSDTTVVSPALSLE
ncbi:MAG TPA: hypothetical protein VMO47_11500 [Rhodothermales bacterium]|nr:hypothetical protein [Rhodothermales bacterium]